MNSTDNLPEGLVSADLGISKWLVMTVRGKTSRDCNVADYPINDFLELIPQEYKDAVYPPIKEVNWHFQIDGDKTYYMSYIESEREFTNEAGEVVHEIRYYAPLRG